VTRHCPSCVVLGTFIPPFFNCDPIFLRPLVAPLSQVHGESSATSQSSLHSQTGTSFEASEEAPQEAASCVRLFVEMTALPTLILIFDIHQAIRGPKVLQEAWDKHKTVRQKYACTRSDRECLIIDGATRHGSFCQLHSSRFGRFAEPQRIWGLGTRRFCHGSTNSSEWGSLH
jgi:hypothetical protein